MTYTNPPRLQPLSTEPTDIVGEYAFDGDLLSRRNLAVRLTDYLDRLRAGAVLAIDAEWGEGKTWFGRNWEKQLQDNEHKTVFIDAFEQDYIEDPFLLIASEIAEALADDKDNTRLFREKAAGVLKAILPVGTKALINIAGKLALGSIDASDEIEKAVEAANGSTADAASKWIEKKIQNHALEKASLQHFKLALKDLASEQGRPIVVFIDELDRCRPIFAVQMIERIKHFFDVPNVVFVLLMNRAQLENAIKGVYGADTNAAAYLGKFINFFFNLPKQDDLNNYTRTYGIYVDTILSRYDFDLTRGKHDEFKDCLLILSNQLKLSLRDIERSIALYAFAQPFNKENSFILAYAIVLKIKNPKIFKRILVGDFVAHQEAYAILNQCKIYNNYYLEFFKQLHSAHMGEFKELGPYVKVYLERSRDPKEFFNEIAKYIDLPIRI